jgi:hypothetical protein
VKKDQLSRYVGRQFRLRPHPFQKVPNGAFVFLSDDKWTLNALEESYIELSNPKTGHIKRLGNDNVREVRSDDFLLLHCYLTIDGSCVTHEPILHPQSADLLVQIRGMLAGQQGGMRSSLADHSYLSLQKSLRLEET